MGMEMTSSLPVMAHGWYIPHSFIDENIPNSLPNFLTLTTLQEF